MRTSLQHARTKTAVSSVFALLVVAVGAFSASLAHAWTPTTPQISVAVLGGSGASSLASSVVSDSSGNIYVAGGFFGTTDFDPGPGVANLTAEGLDDAYVLKLDSSGNYVWAKRVGGNGVNGDLAWDLVVDSAGNVYVAGDFQNTVDFDPGPGTANLTSAGSYDAFVLKLDSSGNYVWAKRVGGTGDQLGRGASIDSSGNVYVAGWFGGTADFDPGAGTANLTSAGSSDGYVLKLTSAGNYLWAKRVGGSSYDDQCKCASVDTAGNVYVSGSFSGTADFDPGPGVANLTSAGSSDAFALKLDSAGNYVWAKRVGASGSDAARDVSVDTAGNVYVAGSFGGTADFDPGPGVANLTSAGSSDAFALKLDSAGNYVWAKGMGDYGWGVSGDAAGNVYVAGGFSGTVDLDPGSGSTNLTSAGSYDAFVLKLDSSGNYVWVRQVGGTGMDATWNVSVDASGNTYVAGSFENTTTLNLGLGAVNLNAAGTRDSLILKMDDLGGSASTTSTTGVPSTTTTTSSPSTTSTTTTTLPRATTTTTLAPPRTTVPPSTTLAPLLPAPERFDVKMNDQHLFISWSPVRWAKTYQVSRDGQVIATTGWASVFDRARASALGTYSYSVRAISASGVAGPASTKVITVTPPSAPALLSSSVLARSVRVTVSLSADTVTWQLLRNGSAIGIYPASRTSVSISQSPGTYSFSLRAVSRTGTTESAQPFSVTVAR